jgi:photosystem II stability/assembly factor-like uncharacterized protein
MSSSKITRRPVFFILAVLVLSASAWTAPPGAAEENSLFRSLHWRNIGPANMGGRISEIQALDREFSHLVVGSASGGVWKSLNAGTTWEPIFDTYGTSSIGSVALCQTDPRIIWVGTGEANVRNSVIWGDGVYKSTDGGRTFLHMGLKESHHVGRIVIHPRDPETVYVASQGHLWGHTGERGLFKTMDGGRTWARLSGGLPDDGKTGCNDVKLDPRDPDILYASFWERLRRPHRFDSGGPHGGIFKSTDGGRTWTRLSEGLPSGDLGRIGLALYRSNPDILMAVVEHGFQPRRSDRDYDDMSKLGTGVYRSEDGGLTWTYVNRANNRPFYYSHIYINPLDDQRVYLMGTRVQVSSDGGGTFEDGMPGIAGDYHCMWLDPQNADRYYVANDKGLSLTHDHGKHFNFFDNFCISQIYEVSADRRDPYFVYVGLQDNGVWGGPSNSRDFNGILNDHWFKFHSGDGFYTAPDPGDWTTVYSESQRGRMRRNHAILRQRSVTISPTQSNTANWKDVLPATEDAGRPTLRWNWNSPFLVSRHNSQTLYAGANFLFKSVDRGDHWRVISPDLTTAHEDKILRESGGLTRDVTGAETHCTIVTLSESPLEQGLIWAGTDDGNIQLTRDDGATWDNVAANITGIPDSLYVSRVEASHFEAGTCYAAFDGHRCDVFGPFLFRTKDFGKTWENISAGLPGDQTIFALREDPVNRLFLVVGTQTGVFATLDGGETWHRLGLGLPTVPVNDLLLHPTAGDLIAGTHGRGVWILDDISPYQQAEGAVMAKEAHLFKPRAATQWSGISRGGTRGHQLFVGENPPTLSRVDPSNSPSDLVSSAALHYYLKSPAVEAPELRISALDGGGEIRIKLDSSTGFHRYLWDMRFAPSSRAMDGFRRNIQSLLGRLREGADRAQRKILDGLEKDLQKAETVDELNHIRENIFDRFRNLITGREAFFPSVTGPQAAPGTYLLEFRLADYKQTGSLVILPDPLLDR